MTLTLGELAAFVTLDDKDFDKGLGGSEGKFQAFGKRLGASALALGAAAATALAAGLVEAMSVEAANDKLAAQLGLTEQESARIGGVAGRLYADAYGANLEEVNTAVAAVISSIDGMRDASDEAVESMTAKVLDLATAFEVDTARAAQVVGQMITSGLAKDATHAMDLLVASMQKVPAAVREDLMDAIDEYGPFMQAIGITGQQAMELLVKGAEKGMYGIDKTGDALKEFTIRATDMSTATQDAYKVLRLDTEKTTRELLAGGETAEKAFNRIITGLLKIQDPAKQSQAALALFGTPLEDLSVAEIPKFLASLTSAQGKLGDVTGAAQRMGDTLNDNAQTKIEAFKRSITTAFVEFVGGQVIPVIEKVVGWLRDHFGPQLETVGKIINEVAIPAIAALATAVLAAGIKMAIGWLIGLGPIALIAAAVIGLAALIIANWDEITGALGVFWEIIKQRAQNTWEGIKVVIINPITDAARWVGDRIRDILGFFDWMRDLPGKVAGWFGQIREGAIQKLVELADWVRGLPQRILEALGDLGNLLVRAGRALIDGLIRGIRDAWAAERGVIIDISTWIASHKGPLDKDRRLLIPHGMAIMQGFHSGLERGFGSVQALITGMTAQLAAPGLATAMGTPGGGAFALAGDQRALVTIDTFNATPDQTPHDIATELDWMSRGGGH